MRMVSKRKILMFLVLALVIIAALGVGSQFVMACESAIPPAPPC